MRWWLPFISLLFMNCGASRSDPEFKTYYDSFKEIYNENPYAISIGFGETSNQNIGECFFSMKQITIRKSSWDGLGILGREALVFHELGHCLWNLKHIDTMTDFYGTPIPGSIMNRRFDGDSYYYKERRKDFINELPRNAVVTLGGCHD